MYNPGWVHYLRDQEIYLLVSLIEKYAKQPADSLRILEIGSGDGYMAYKLDTLGYQVISTEPVPRLPLQTTILQATAYKLPFPDKSFDIIFSSNVLEHILEFPIALKEMKRLLTQSGFMIHTMPSTACSLLTTLTTPFVYPRTLKLLSKGYFFTGIDLSRPIKLRSTFVFNDNVKMRVFLRKIWIAYMRATPLRLIRLDGHGVARNPLHELIMWRRENWREKFDACDASVVEITGVKIIASMNKLLGKRLLPLRHGLGNIGLHVTYSYVVSFQ